MAEPWPFIGLLVPSIELLIGPICCPDPLAGGAGSEVIANIPPGTRIAVEVDEYDNRTQTFQVLTGGI